MIVGAGAHEIERQPVFPGPLLHQARDLHLGQPRRNVLQLATAQFLRDLPEQIVDAVDADGIEHLADFRVGMGDERHYSSAVTTSMTPGARLMPSGW